MRSRRIRFCPMTKGENSMPRKVKTFAAAVVVAATAALAATVVPAASAEAPFPCPPETAGWFLTSPSPGDVFFDHNGDGLICVKFVGPGRGSSRDVPGFTARDDLFFVDDF
jgi:hypothetical protein